MQSRGCPRGELAERLPGHLLPKVNQVFGSIRQLLGGSSPKTQRQVIDLAKAQDKDGFLIGCVREAVAFCGDLGKGRPGKGWVLSSPWEADYWGEKLSSE